jgi:4'-phosphopantetheinyl transferase
LTHGEPPARGHVVLHSLAVRDLSPSCIAALAGVLSSEETARADRFRFAADRVSYIAAHALLRRLLAAHGVPEPHFVLGPWGKPELAGPAARMRFSVTHTRTLVAGAVAFVDDLGIDAEAIDAGIDILPLAARFFAPVEAAALHALPIPERAAAFCQMWTLKEAFVKALGLGLSQPLDSFAFAGPDRFSCDAALGDPQAWSFQSRATETGCYLAVALRRPRDPGMVLHHTAMTAADANNIPT